jgi:hypothetical protein
MGLTTNQLRLGNKLYHHYAGVFTVRQILEDRVSVKEDNGKPGGHEYFLMTELEPIRLDEEWLQAFHFNKTENEIWIFDPLKIQTGRPFAVIIGDSYSCKNIAYVHELQNLYFSLTGKELKTFEDMFPID